ncbi:MAG: Uma2 family endonuclease [Gemmataceae bacterium]|nr:Uma2 family endonuclease [Gemmataceae bacterium]
MTQLPATGTAPELGYWPNHLELPCEDGTFVRNFQELPQAMLLTEPLDPWLRRLHPDGHYCIGQDSGIYYRRIPEPPYAKAIAPNWYFVPNVPPLRDGQMRRSYVMWDEPRAPLILVEFVSGTGAEERDRTPETGKFWIYEHAIRPGYYGIYEVDPGRVEVYRFVADRFEPLAANERGHFPIEPTGLELGIWKGPYQNVELPWLRWFDREGRLLPTGQEKAERLAAKLRELGVDPETL